MTVTPDTRPILEAISLRRCIEVVYNRTRMKLAPHILYTRGGDLFLDAVAVEREGRMARELRVGTFKLAGLRLVDTLPQGFDPMHSFDPDDAKYQETTPFAVG